MRRTVLAMFVAAGLGLTGYLWAGDGGGEKKECPIAAAAAKAAGEAKTCSGKAGGEGCVKKELAENASYKRANEVLKSWQEVPAKLAAMSETDKGDLQEAAKKLHATHPAASAFRPTVGFLRTGLATVTEIDAASARMCAAAAKAATQPAALAAGEQVPVQAEEHVCPKTAAVMTSAKKKMRQSVALTAKANELILAVYSSSGELGCGKDKDAAKASLTSGEEKTCAKSAALASGEEKAGCAASAALAKAEGKAGGCCPDKAKAAMASAGPACCAGKDQPCCVAKTLTARSEAAVAASGDLMAKWQGASIRMAAMESAERESVDKFAQETSARCPIGARMPETMETIALLLRDAAALNAQAMAECAKNPGMAKMVSAEARQLAETRGLLLSSMINVLEKSSSVMRPARQVASAQ